MLPVFISLEPVLQASRLSFPHVSRLPFPQPSEIPSYQPDHLIEEEILYVKKQAEAILMSEIAYDFERRPDAINFGDQVLTWYDKSYAAGYLPALGMKNTFIERLKKTGNIGKLNLGDFNLNGTGMPKNLREAARWYLSVDPQEVPEVVQKLEKCCQEMIQAKDWEGLAMVADAYYEGIGRDVDFEKAASLYSQCNLTDFPKALSQLLDCYGRMAHQGDITAMYNLGVLSEQKKDLTSAAYWFHRGAEKGHLGAMYAWATYLEKGVTIEANPEQAVVWYEKAAREGCCKHAAYRLWQIYQSRHDEQSAQKYLNLAALWGHIKAMFEWAVCLESGIGAAQDPEQAIAWYKKALERGCYRSAVQLTQIYLNQQDLPSALVYLEKSAQLVDEYAQSL